MGLYEQACDYIRKHQMIPSNSRVVAAVSGGADSMCLLHLMSEMREPLQLTVFCIHVHHGLRGEEADRDARFVERVCGEWGIPCKIIRRDVKAFARLKRLSLEEAGRLLRYEALEQEADALAADSIATAHHSEDAAETVFHHIVRGSGLKGLGGIRPVRGRIIRPLLFADKKDILNYLALREIGHCEDSTNQDVNFTRNRIRSQWIPLARELNTRAVENVQKLADLAAQADAYLENQASQILKDGIVSCGYDKEAGQWELFLNQLLCREEILQKYLIRIVLETLSGSARNISSRHVEAVLDLASGRSGRELSLPYGLTARKAYEKLVIESQKQGTARDNDILEHNCFANCQLRQFDYEKGMEIPKNKYTKWFDYDKIKGTPIWRRRQASDYISLNNGGHKSVKNFMIDAKIPRQDRGRILLLADESHILWIVGWRISEYYKVTENTRRILEASVKDGGEDGE